ncbi:MAG TPA: hypothetical protein VHD84_01475 [Candidatus Saccharimonadales bacterium]|nr:hypothetical protein [Candidatus Saccharimonadales bacterium]
MDEGVPAKAARRRFFSKMSLAILILIIIIAAAATGWWISRSTSPIPDKISSEVLFPLYYPASLPAGYSIDQNSFDLDNEVVVFGAKNSSGKTIAITEQPKPDNFDFDTFYSQHLSATKQVVTRSGNAVIGLMNTNPVASLATDKTWVIVTFPANMPANNVEQTTESLTESGS